MLIAGRSIPQYPLSDDGVPFLEGMGFQGTVENTGYGMNHGNVASSRESWTRNTKALLAFKGRTGHCNVSAKKTVKGQVNNDYKLGKWVSTIWP